ncbi:MAG: rod shape-determining protein MreC [Sphingobacteriales bacterium]|nr:rod shape-determining protein MreC [Sphingobacteriales bacterium]
MRNVFLFISRYRTFISFLVLQVLSLWFLFSYNRFHRARFLGVANEVTGRINTQYNKVEDFFALKAENQRLHRFNDSLLGLLPRNFSVHDTSMRQLQDSVPYDTAGHYRRYSYYPATVVYNTVNAQKNYLQINRGSAQGIRDNMAVMGSDGSAVGVVVNVSANFSQVMSLLHVQSSVSASLKRSGDFGTAEWDGKDPRYLLLKRIPKSVEVKKGDSVLTSPVSFSFPPGCLLGTIEAVTLDNTTGMYLLKVKTAANFLNLQQVHVVGNLDFEEQTRLNQETKKIIEEPKKTPR